MRTRNFVIATGPAIALEAGGRDAVAATMAAVSPANHRAPPRRANTKATKAGAFAVAMQNKGTACPNGTTSFRGTRPDRWAQRDLPGVPVQRDRRSGWRGRCGGAGRRGRGTGPMGPAGSGRRGRCHGPGRALDRRAAGPGRHLREKRARDGLSQPTARPAIPISLAAAETTSGAPSAGPQYGPGRQRPASYRA